MGGASGQGAMAPPAVALQVACVQLGLDLADYTREERFRRQILSLCEQVAARREAGLPLLVAFPEDTGTFLAFLDEARVVETARSLREAVQALVRRHLGPVVWQRLVRRVGWTRALGLILARRMEAVYRSVFAEAARLCDAWLVAGSALLPLDGSALRQGGRRGEMAGGGRPGGLPGSGRPAGEPGLYNASYIFSPAGELAGVQPKAHLIDLEAAEGLDLAAAPLEALSVVPTPFGTLGVAICFDAFHDDVLGLLHRGGARILVQPSANPGPWTPEQQQDWLNGSWAATVERGLFSLAVNPMLVGDAFDLRFEGQSAIVVRPHAGRRTPGAHPGRRPPGPAGYTAVAPRPGFAAVARDPRGEEVLLVQVCLEEEEDAP